MSASSAVARRAAVRNGAPFLRNANSASAVSRALLGGSAGFVGRSLRTPRYVNALAILVPARHMGTEHHRLGPTPSTGPPPGFSAETAKKPLPKETATSTAPKQEPASPEPAPPATIASQAPVAKKDVPAKVSAGIQKGDASLTESATVKQGGVDKADEEKRKATIWEKVKKEAQHYWDGTKLLATEVKISWRLALKMAAGYELSRRENRQLRRTIQDLGRLVPFSVFIIVPLGELVLPLALRLFPNMLPSTYEGQKSKEKKASLLRTTRKEVSDFLRESIRETGLPLSRATTQKEEFSNFFRTVRSTGEKPTDQDVIKVCKTFRDDLTLDNLSRPQLVSMCRYMNLNTFGTDNMLRYQIRHRMRQIKRDDRAISFEGVDSLTVSELQTACASRGIRTHGVSPARMRTDLQTWLDLRLQEGVPSTILVLSSAYMYNQYSGDDGNQIEALIGVLSSIPEELYHEIELEVHDAEGAATNKQRLEVLKEQEELIEDENEQSQESESTGFASPRDVDNIDEKEEQLQAQAKHVGAEEKQVGEMIDAQRDGVAAEKLVEEEEKKI